MSQKMMAKIKRMKKKMKKKKKQIIKNQIHFQKKIN